MTTIDELNEGQRLYERTRDELAADARSTSESYDRALLTLSSAFLGGSLAFVGQLVDLGTAIVKWMLYSSWGLFALTIVITISSLMHALHQFQPLRDAAERYYLEGEQEAWKVSEFKQRVVLRFVVACGVSFILGVLLLILFVSINLA